MVILGELIHGLTQEQYSVAGTQMQALRSSMLGALKRSPAHLREQMLHPKPATDAMKLGSLIHSAFEDPEGFAKSILVIPKFTGLTKDGRESEQSGEARAKKAAWFKNLPGGCTAVTQDEADAILGIVRAASKHRLLAGLINGAVKEVSGFVKDPETGVMLMFRPDAIASDGYLIDFKSCMSAQVRDFTNDIFSERGRFYILNAAHYVHCAKLMGISKSDAMTLVALEKEPPHGINIFPLCEAHLDVGERWRKILTKRYAECLAKDEWPGYSEEAVVVSVPAYCSIPEESLEEA